VYIKTFENEGNTAEEAIDSVELETNDFLAAMTPEDVVSIQAQTLYEYYGSNQYGDPRMSYRHIVTVVCRGIEANIDQDQV
jgi:hypothetical protein